MSHDIRVLRSRLPKHIFKPFWPRALTLLVIQCVGVSLIYVLSTQQLVWPIKLFCSLTIGYCWAMGGLIGHELMHGSILRNKRVQDLWGFFCFLPFMISPTFWKYWHNNLHHSHTQKLIMDPDAYPNLRIYKQSKYIQKMYRFTPGSGYKRSYLYFFFWFTLNAIVAQFYFRFRNKIFNKLNNRRVNVELFLIIITHGVALYLTGPTHWLWVAVIPFTVQNYIPFSYISTNHNLSALTKHNDVLENTLTVTNHPILEFMHINFGYHAEHHMFPTMSGKHLKIVHRELKRIWPRDFHYMPKWKAIRALYATARIYKNNHTLINPLTGESFPTLQRPKDRPQLLTDFKNIPMAEPQNKQGLTL